MASVHNTSAETWDLPTPIIVGCKLEVAEKLSALVSIFSGHKTSAGPQFRPYRKLHVSLAMLPCSEIPLEKDTADTGPSIQPTNETLYLPSPPLSFHTKFMSGPGNNASQTATDTVYFALPTQPLRPEQGFVFSRIEMHADFQLPKEAPETAHAAEFRITINENVEWTLVDESITGVTVNGARLYSTENQTLLARTGYRLTNNPCPGTTLLVDEPNSIQVGWGGLQFDLYVLGKAADYCRCPTFFQPRQSLPFSPTLPQLSQHVTGTHMLETTDDIDAELHRQTGGDLTRGFYIDPARFARAADPCPPSAAGCAGGDVGMGSDDQEWAVLASLGQLELRGDEEGFEAMES